MKKTFLRRCTPQDDFFKEDVYYYVKYSSNVTYSSLRQESKIVFLKEFFDTVDAYAAGNRVCELFYDTNT